MENELCTVPVSHSQGIQAHKRIEISPTEDQSVIKRLYYDVEHGGQCHSPLSLPICLLIAFPFFCLFFSFTHHSLSRQNCPRSRCHGHKPSGQECSAGCHSGTRSPCTDEGLRTHKKRVSQTHMNIHKRQTGQWSNKDQVAVGQRDFNTRGVLKHEAKENAWNPLNCGEVIVEQATQQISCIKMLLLRIYCILRISIRDHFLRMREFKFDVVAFAQALAWGTYLICHV